MGCNEPRIKGEKLAGVPLTGRCFLKSRRKKLSGVGLTVFFGWLLNCFWPLDGLDESMTGRAALLVARAVCSLRINIDKSLKL